MSKENQMVKKESTAMAEIDYSSLASEFAGAVEVREKLLRIPRLLLTQGLSAASSSGVARVGEFYSAVKGQNYGKEVTIIPILISESASLVDDQTSKLKCHSSDMVKNRDGVACASCPHHEYWNDWGTKDNPKTPACKMNINVVCLIDGDTRPVVMSFRKMNHDSGKALMNKVINDRLPFASKYVLRSQETTSKKGHNFMIVNQAMEKIPLTTEELKRVIPIARDLMERKRKDQIEHAADEGESDDADLGSVVDAEKDEFGF